MLLRFRPWLDRLLQNPARPAQAREGRSRDHGSEGALLEERSRRLAAETELQSLRLDLAQSRQQLDQMRAEFQRQGRAEAAMLQDHLGTQLEEVLAPLAAPLTQLLAQQHLIEREGKELTAKDVLATSGRLWRELAPIGVEALESMGEVVPFDPDRHHPLSQGTPVEAGQAVRVRIPGLLLKGRVLKTASVEVMAPAAMARGDRSPG